jgi:hypothetical protein
MSETQESKAPTPQGLIDGMVFGYILSRALHVVAELGIADLLSSGPRPVVELARTAGAHQQSLHRLLRMLASYGVFAEAEAGCFQLTPLAATLQTQIPGSLRDRVKMYDEACWNAVGNLLHSVRTGEPAFNQVNGLPLFEHYARNPGANMRFDRGMASATTAENAAIVSSYDFNQFHRIVDVGGGLGGFLTEVLKASPALTGVLYDQPQVVKEPEHILEAGLIDRCEIVEGNFFESVPAGADAYVLKRVLHDWNDDIAVSLLGRCREAMTRDGRVLTLDAVVPPGNQPHRSKTMDILMMALLGGRERTEQECRELYQRAGLKLTKIVPTGSMLSIVEGVRA